MNMFHRMAANRTVKEFKIIIWSTKSGFMQKSHSNHHSKSLDSSGNYGLLNFHEGKENDNSKSKMNHYTVK